MSRRPLPSVSTSPCARAVREPPRGQGVKISSRGSLATACPKDRIAAGPGDRLSAPDSVHQTVRSEIAQDRRRDLLDGLVGR